MADAHRSGRPRDTSESLRLLKLECSESRCREIALIGLLPCDSVLLRDKEGHVASEEELLEGKLW